MSDRDALEQLTSAYIEQRLSRRQFMLRAAALGIGASAAATLLAACASEASPSPATAAPTAAPGSEAPPTTVPTAAPSGGPRLGGIFKEGYDRDVTRMDPVASPWADPAYSAIWERSMTMSPDGKVVGQLAESWEFSPDAKTLTIKLVTGHKLQSGKEVDAAMVAEDFKIFASDKAQNPPFWVPMESVEATDATTLVLKFKQPFAAMIWTIKGEYTEAFDPATRTAAGEDWGTKTADGSGPFTLKSFVPGEGTVVAKWADYPGSSISFIENKGPAYVDEVHWVPILEAANRANELEAGNVLAIKRPLGADIPRLMDNPDLVVIEYPELSNYFLALNFKRTQLGFDDLKVRQAISHAIDRKGIVNSVLFGHGEGTTGPIASSFVYYNPEVEQYNLYDPEKAKSLLAEAGWVAGSDGIVAKNGTPLSFEIVNLSDTEFNFVMQAVSDQLKAVGIAAQPKNLEAATFYSPDGFQGDVDAFTFKWLWPSPVDVVSLFVKDLPFVSTSGKDQLPDVVNAYLQWQNAATDAELEAAAKAAQKVHAEQLPYIPVYTPNVVWAHSKKLHGWMPTKGNLYPYYNDVWFEE